MDGSGKAWEGKGEGCRIGSGRRDFPVESGGEVLGVEFPPRKNTVERFFC